MGLFRTRSGVGWLGLVAVLAGPGLTGCGSDVTKDAGSGGGTGTGGGATGFAGVAFSGVVLGAGQPVGEATVQVYAAGTSGAGAGANALLSSALITDGQGRFRVPAGYVCASSATEVYVLARGGSVGGAAKGNAALAEMAVPGACGTIAAGASFTVDEATTVAAAWAMQRFLAPDGTVGGSATNAAGLANAVLMAQALVSVQTGTAPGSGFPATATPPSKKVNTLANLLSRCTVDGTSPACAGVLEKAPGRDGTPAADTLAAAIGMASAPAANVGALYGLSQGAAGYAPALTAAPLDWMLAMTYTGGGLLAVQGPTTIAIDAGGNAWVANYGGVVSVFSPVGDPLFAKGIRGGGLNNSYGLALDASGDAWVSNGASDAGVNDGRGTVTKISAGGEFLSGAAGFSNDFQTGGFSVPVAVAIDPNGTVWVVNTQNSTVTQLDGSGQTTSGNAGYGSSALAFPAAIALDADHNAWVANTYTDTVVKISPDGRQVQAVSLSGNGPQGIAIDASGFVWTADYYSNSVSRVQARGATVAAGGPYSGGTLSTPEAIAVDGAGDVWVGSFRDSVLTELAGSAAAVPGRAISPAAGWASDAGLAEPFGIAVDQSGDVWVSNFAGGSVTELIGVAAPVRTPLLGPVQQP